MGSQLGVSRPTVRFDSSFVFSEKLNISDVMRKALVIDHMHVIRCANPLR